MLYPGLTALGPKMYIGPVALGTKMYPRLHAPGTQRHAEYDLPPIFICHRIIDTALSSFHYIEFIWTVCTDQFFGV